MTTKIQQLEDRVKALEKKKNPHKDEGEGTFTIILKYLFWIVLVFGLILLITSIISDLLFSGGCWMT